MAFFFWNFPFFQSLITSKAILSFNKTSISSGTYVIVICSLTWRSVTFSANRPHNNPYFAFSITIFKKPSWTTSFTSIIYGHAMPWCNWHIPRTSLIFLPGSMFRSCFVHSLHQRFLIYIQHHLFFLAPVILHHVYPLVSKWALSHFFHSSPPTHKSILLFAITFSFFHCLLSGSSGSNAQSLCQKIILLPLSYFGFNSPSLAQSAPPMTYLSQFSFK